MRDSLILIDALRAGKIDRSGFLRATAAFAFGTAEVVTAALPVFANANATPTHPPMKTRYSIGFSQSEINSDWRKAESDSMAAEAKRRAATYDCRQTVANSDTTKQIADVADLIAANVDLIVLTPREQGPLVAATDKARAAGIPVIEIDRTTTGEVGRDFVCAITSNFVQQGNKVGRWMIENTTGPINYVELLGTAGASPAILRAKGFHDVIDAERRFRLLGAQDGDFTLAGGRAIMTKFIARFGQNIDMVYAHNDDMAVGAQLAMREARFAKKVYIGSIDGTRRGIEYVAEGVFSVVVQSDPHFGPITFDVIERYFTGQAIPGSITVQDITYTKANAEHLIGTGF